MLERSHVDHAGRVNLIFNIIGVASHLHISVNGLTMHGTDRNKHPDSSSKRASAHAHAALQSLNLLHVAGVSIRFTHSLQEAFTHSSMTQSKLESLDFESTNRFLASVVKCQLPP